MFAKTNSNMIIILVLATFASLPSVLSQGPGYQCFDQADIIFVVDSSGSINDANPRNWNIVLNFITQIVDELNIGFLSIRVGMVTFSNRGKVQFQLNTYNTSDEVKTAVRNTEYLGANTNTSGGLLEMLGMFSPQNGDRTDAPDTVIVITDGVSTVDTDTTQSNAKAARDRGIYMLVIGITDQIDMTELEGMASLNSTGQPSVYTVSDFDRVEDILDQVVSETCFEPTTTTTTTTEAPIPDPLPCMQRTDLMIVLDSSGSVEAGNFNDVTTWLAGFVEQLDIEGDFVDVGMVTYATDATLQFDLNRYTDRPSLMEAIAQVQFTGGTTNTAAALRISRERLVANRRQDRSQVILLITNGQSNRPDDTLEQAMLTKQEDVHIIVVVVGNWFNMQEINGIASHPYEESRINLNDFTQFNNGFTDTIRDLICNNFDDCASDPCINDVRCLDGIGFYSCVCTQGWGGINCGQRCNERLDIAFALDASTSIGPENFEQMVNFVRTVIQGLRIGTSDSSSPTRVGLMTYSDDTEVIFHLNAYQNKYDILNAFPPYYTRGTTRTELALRNVRENMFTFANGDQPGVRNLLVLITDGRSTNEEDTWEQARLTREAGIDILTIGIGQSIRQSELEAIASYPNVVGDNVLLAPAFSALNQYIDDIINVACDNGDDCINNNCRNGATCVDRTNGYECRCRDGFSGRFCERNMCLERTNGYKCRCRDGFSGRFCERNCDGRADVLFAIDVSGSIRRERFPMIQAFVKGIIDQFEVSQEKTRIGVVSWSDSAGVEFYLNQYQLKQDVLTAIGYMDYLGGRTHSASALRLLREQVLTGSRGDRDDVPDFLYVITDGNSNINQELTVQEAIRLRAEGVYIMTVSVGTQLNQLELMGMVSDPVNDNMFAVERFDLLPSLTERMPQRICDSLNECASNPCRNGGECLNELNAYRCACPEGRTGRNCQLTCRRSVDITFMIDLSGSTLDEYQRAINFVREAVYGFDFTFSRARIAVITYGDTATTQFRLDTYNSQIEVLNALRFIPNIGRTNTQQAINRMRNDVFRASGNRQGVPDIGILVTDGFSNVNRGNTIPEANRAKSENIEMYVVPLGTETDMAEVNGIANQPSNEYVYPVEREDMAASVAARLINHICQ